MRLLFLSVLSFSFTANLAWGQLIEQVDICVYGGTSAGVIAAYSAKKMGKSVVLIEPGRHLGGLTSGGLGYTDIGNKYAISGLALDFYRKLGKHYGNFEQWIFEPSVAEKTFQEYIKAAQVPVIYQYRLKDIKRQNDYISEIIIEPSEKVSGTGNQVIKAKIFIDCTYEGDLMAKAGISYTIGREANNRYGETYNGVQLMTKHQFPDGIDPYKTPGDPSSGLVWGISDGQLANRGSGDKKVQAYNFRVCLTNDPANRIAISRPGDYDSTKYELLLRYIKKIDARDLKAFLKIDKMPNAKTDINNNGPFSTDMIGMNYNYPEADYTTREKIIKAHENYVKGLLYFIGHDARMPAYLREQMLSWGYPRDEYTDNGHWSPQMYVRETRRMIGEYVMTQANCESREVVADGIGMAAYTMDSHNCQRLVIEKDGMAMVKNEGNVEIGGFGPFPISYRAIIPKEKECKNMLVPVCLSASHIAYGSIRMEPVFMLLAQSSAIAASLAIDNKLPVQKIPASRIKKILEENPLLDGTQPDILVDDADEKQVVKVGKWKKLTRRSFGPSMLVSDTGVNAASSVRFIPVIKKAGDYSVYTYFPRLDKMADQVAIIIYDGSQKHTTAIRTHEVKIAGQTSGEWVYLGDFYFSANSKPYVEFSNGETKGMIVADAVLLKAKIK